MKKATNSGAEKGGGASAKDLITSGEWMKTIIEESRDAIFISDINSRFIFVNKAACQLTGYTKRELLSMKIPDLHKQQDLSAYKEYYDQILNGEEVLTESRILRKDGVKVDTEFNIKRIKSDGKIFVHTSARDITGRHNAEKDLRESEEKYRILTESSPEMIYVVDKRGYILFVNSKAANQFGEKADKIVGRRLSDLFPAETAKRNLERVKQVFKTGTPQISEVEMEFPGGKTWLEAKLSPVFDQEKNVTAVLGLSTDISVRKNTELLLKASEEKFRALFYNIADVVCLISPDGQIISLNPAFEKSFGYKREEWLNRPINNLVHPDDLDAAYESIKDILAGVTPYIIDVRVICKSGEIKTVEVNPSQLKIGNVLIGALGILRDITERKRTEEIIGAKNELLNKMGRIAKIGGWEFDVETGEGAWTEEVARIHEVEPAARTSRDFGLKFFKGKDLIKIKNAIKEAVELGKSYDLQLKMTSAKGKEKWVQTIGHPVKVKGKIVKLRGTFQDVTDQVKTGEKIREQEYMLSQAQKLAHIGNWGWDFNGPAIWSDEAYKIYGVSPETFIPTMDSLFELIHPEDRQLMKNWVDECLSGKSPKNLEFRIIRPDKSVRYLLGSGDLLRDNMKNPVYIGGSVQDITERKLIEKNVRQSEEKYRNLFENVGIAIWEEDLSGVKKYLDDLKTRKVKDFGKYFEENPEEVFKCMSLVKVININKEVIQIVKARNKDEAMANLSIYFTEDSIDAAKDEIVALAEGKLRTDGEIALKLPGGEIREFLFQLSISPGYEKNWGRALFSFIDITDRRVAERELKESEDRYKDLFENSSDLICMHDMEGNLVMANYAAEKLTGYTREELLCMRIQDLIDPQYRPQFSDYLDRLSTENTAGGIMIIRTKAGERRYWLYNNSLRSEGVEQPVVRGIAKDITEQKLAEIKLQKNKDELQRFFDDDIAAVFLTTVEGKILECNRTFLRVFGFDKNEDAQKINIRDYYANPLDRDELLENVSKNGRVELYELEFKSCGGKPVHALLNAVGIFNDYGKLTTLKGYVVDVSNWKKAQEEIRKLSRAVDQSPVSVVITDPDGNIEYVNPKFTEVTGYELNEVIGKNPRILKSGRQSKEFYEDLWDTILSGKNYTCEMYNKKKNGEYYWEKAFISPLLNNSGDITHFVAIKEDITEKKLNEESLNLFRSLVNQTNDTIEIIAPDTGKFLLCNEKSYQMLGYTQEEFLALKVMDIDPGVNDEIFKDMVHKIRQSESLLIESTHRRKDGSVFPVELNIKSVHLEREYLIVVGRDITRRKNERMELIKAKEAAEQSNQLKDAFIANISHEIRTPLNGILGLTGIIKENYGNIIDDEDNELFDGIDSSGKRIIRTVDMILNYSRLQVGEYSIETREVNVETICKNLMKEYRTTAEYKSLELSFENKCKNCVIETDEYSLTQAVSNLIDNSIKYTKTGSVSITLRRDEDSNLLLEICDTGIGMSSEFKEKIFEPYLQEQMGYGRAYEGVGLGLSLVKKFIDNIKAKLIIESEKGKGTTVTINFGKIARKGEPGKETEIIKPPASVQKVEKKNKLILMVEDDAMNQTTIKRAFRDRYDLQIADSSDSAMKILRNNSVDLVLMDISIMGSRNGLELTMEMKNDDRYRKIPVIAVTAHAFERDKQNALDAGCDDYLAKPFSIEELLTKIRQFM